MDAQRRQHPAIQALASLGRLIVTDPPAGKFGTLPETLLPATVGGAQVAPPIGDPQLAVTPVIAAGTLSAQVVPSAALGPAFDTTSV